MNKININIFLLLVLTPVLLFFIEPTKKAIVIPINVLDIFFFEAINIKFREFI